MMFPDVLQSPAKEVREGLFHPAPLATLRPNSGCHFELYLALAHRTGRRYILFKAADIELSERKRRELLENGVSTLYVKEDDAGDYYEYVDRTVGQVLASDSVRPQEKSQILYETSQSLVKSAFERPQSPLLMSGNQKLVTHTVTTIAAEPAMLRTMVSMFTFDYSLYTHSVHVSVLGSGLLLEINDQSVDEIRDVAMGYLLHDIGKCRVPAEIVRKPGMLTPFEARQMERHPEHGVGLMQHHEVINTKALEVIRNHHEKLDGTGYPHHLTGGSLSLETRICSMVDVFDALTSHRAYKAAMTAFDACHTMTTRMSQELDQELMRLLIHRLGPNARQPV